MSDYVCAECGEPIVGETPHTAPDGADLHEECCDDEGCVS